MNDTDNTDGNRPKKGKKPELSPGGLAEQTSVMDVSEEGHGEVDKEVVRTLAFADLVDLGEGVGLGAVGGELQGGRADGGGAESQ